MKRAVILGVTIDGLRPAEAVEKLHRSLQAGQARHVVTVTNEMVMHAQRDPNFMSILQKADLRLADSAGLVWAAKYLAAPLNRPGGILRAYLQALWYLVVLLLNPSRMRTELPGTVPGSNLVVDLARVAAAEGYGLFLLGAGPGVAEKAGHELTRQFPGLRIAGASDQWSSPADDQAVMRHITQTKPQIVLVALTSPKQEQWIARNLPLLPKPVIAIGVGGTFDYLAGGTSLDGGRPAKAPPASVRRAGLEWLWRLVTQPARWRRIWTALPQFVMTVVKSKIKIDS